MNLICPKLFQVHSVVAASMELCKKRNMLSPRLPTRKSCTFYHFSTQHSFGRNNFDIIVSQSLEIDGELDVYAREDTFTWFTFSLWELAKKMRWEEKEANQVRSVIELRVAEVQKEFNLIKNHHCSNKRSCCCFFILSTHDQGRVRAEEVEESAILSLEQSFHGAKQILYGWKIYDNWLWWTTC